MVDFANIANDAISELKRVKRKSLRFDPPTYLAILEDDTVIFSNLWLILKEAKVAVVILPYSYRVVTAEDASAFILFIDEKGHCNDSIDLNEWNLKFNAPYESLYRTYERHAVISKAGHNVCLKISHGTLTTNDFKRIWKYFKLISTIYEDYVSLPLIKDLYDNEITIESLKKENIRKEYERFTTEALLKANQQLIENLKQTNNYNLITN